MKILCAPDSFKGSLSASDAAQAMEIGLRRVWPDAEITRLPVGDGGEGTSDALVAATNGRFYSHAVTGPLGDSLDARWAALGDRETAVIELASASGLTLVSPDRRDPKITTTRGVGELLLAASQAGYRRIIVALGGSATNDGGAGLLQALGVRFLDGADRDLPLGGAALARLVRLDTTALIFDPPSLELLIACDVDNPLTGSRGASTIFGPQKGATPNDVALLDNALAHFAHVSGVEDFPGAGAAGGTAFGLRVLFPHTVLRPGIDLVLDAVRFDEKVHDADIVFTGEGRLDAQTLNGKVIAGIARRTKVIAPHVFVGALVGSIAPDITGTQLKEAGIDAALPLAPGPCDLETAFAHTADWLADAAERSARWHNPLP